MLDLKFIRENPDKVKKACADRGKPADIDGLLALDGKRRALLKESEDIKRNKNIASDEIAELMREKKDAKAKIMAKLGAHRRAICEGFAINLQVTPENPGRPALPDEIIGKRAEVRKVAVKEWTI